MKIHHTLSALGIICSITVYAQQEVDFHIHYAPEMKYDQTIVQTSTTTMDYPGSVQSLTGSTHRTQRSSIRSVCHTGEANGQRTFPMQIEISDIQSDNPQVKALEGVTMTGHCIVDSLPRLESINAPDMDPDIKQAMLQMMQSLFAQFSYPDRHVKVGEKFSAQSTLSVPVKGFKMTFLLTTRYKLVKIQNGIAKFDIRQKYSMVTNSIAQMSFTAKGKAKGKMDYDIAHQFYSAYQLNTNMDMAVTTQGRNMTMTMQSGYDQHAVISAEH